MAKGTKKKVAFISSFPPRKCGIATFTSDLIKNAGTAAKGQFEPLVVAMRSDSTLKYNDPVKFEIRQDVKSDYICAADYINFSHVDVVSVQHEFGLFGGDAGSYLSLLLNRLKAPVITTLHTLLDDPDPDHHKSLVEVCNASYRIITMNERGLDMLRDIYGISGKKVELIAHGIPDLPFVDSNYYKHKFGMENRRTILTFGLLNKNKGIEVMLKAMPRIIEAEPTILYIVLGMTHPSVLKHEGESYRFRLQRMVKELGLQEHVIFHNRFVHDEELHNFLCAADIYVTPYLNPEQLTSGTLSFAVGTGKAVVSTPYWAAMELLADGRGKLVEFGNSEEIAESIIEILKKSSLFYSLRRRAYDYGRVRTWPKIGQAYWKLFNAKRLPVRITSKMPLSAAETISSIEVPEPSLDHFKKLTDDTGMFQHATYTVPNREYGYTTDDNARAVIAMADYYFQYPQPAALELFDIYLSFILHSQNNDGTVRNFMNFDRSWQKDEPLNDALGRVLWAFGTVMAKPPASSYLSIIKDSFDKSVKHVKKQYPRGMAYSILGMSDYLKQFPGASDIKRQLEIAADELVLQYENNSFPDWQWFEDSLTYDNAVLPHALYVASLTFGDKKYLEVADKTCEFLLETTFTGDHFSFVGCKGWYEHGQTKATFDQQPIDAVSTVMMLRTAYDATGNDRFLTLQRKAFDWFLGENDLHIPLYNFRTKGCYDGLTEDGVNANQGAESTLSFLLSILAIVESYALIDKVKSSKKKSRQPVISIGKQIKKKVALITSIPIKGQIATVPLAPVEDRSPHMDKARINVRQPVKARTQIEIKKPVKVEREVKVHISLPSMNPKRDSILIDGLNKTIREFMDAFDIELKPGCDPVIITGSWIGELWFKFKNTVTADEVQKTYEEMREALRRSTIDSIGAEVYNKRASATGDLLEKLENIDEAMLRLGDVLVVKTKSDGKINLVVRTISPALSRELDAQHKVQNDPKLLLLWLESKGIISGKKSRKQIPIKEVRQDSRSEEKTEEAI